MVDHDVNSLIDSVQFSSFYWKVMALTHWAPGFQTTVRYIRGANFDTGAGFEGRDRERDLDIILKISAGCNSSLKS